MPVQMEPSMLVQVYFAQGRYSAVHVLTRSASVMTIVRVVRKP